MSYMHTTIALIGGAFLLALVAIICIIHASFRQLTETPGKALPAIPEEYRDLLESKRVRSVVRRAHFDVFFRHRLLHQREAALRRWRLSRKERTLLAEMGEGDLEAILNVFSARHKPPS